MHRGIKDISLGSEGLPLIAEVDVLASNSRKDIVVKYGEGRLFDTKQLVSCKMVKRAVTSSALNKNIGDELRP